MNSVIKSIYIFWVGLSKHNYHDIKGLPLPIPIKYIAKERIVIDKRYVIKHNITMKKHDSIYNVAIRYNNDT